MKQVKGLWLPDEDTHFEGQIGEPIFWGKPTYQFRKFAAVFPHIRNFRHAVDVGAHCGLWSRVLGKVFWKVTAFEPVPEHVECLKLNAPVATVEQVALGKDNGTVKMTLGGDNSGNAAVRPDGEVMFPMRTLDSYNLVEVDFLKIDCEGYEQNVLLGAMETIKRERPAIILEQHKSSISSHGLKPSGGLGLLEGLGMKTIAKLNSDYLLTF